MTDIDTTDVSCIECQRLIPAGYRLCVSCVADDEVFARYSTT